MNFTSLLILLVSMLTTNSSKVVHDVPITIFSLYNADEGIGMDVTIDVEDFCKAEQATLASINTELLEKTINEKSHWLFDQKPYEYVITDLISDGDHFKIEGIFSQLCFTPENIKIRNTFLNEVSNQSNIILIDISGINSDYRMHRNRTEIDVQF